MVIGPHRHQVADIDNEGIGGRLDIDPAAAAQFHLQAAERFFRQQNGQRP
jgi:hypothetical protein